MKISDDGMALIKRFEGLRLQAYQDSVGVWTIGYGWTQPVAGRKVGAGMAIDATTAEHLLLCGIAQFRTGRRTAGGGDDHAGAVRCAGELCL